MKHFSCVFLLLISLSFEALADPWKNLAHGDKTAQDFLNSLDKEKTQAGPHPFYNGKSPKESNLKDSELKGRTQGVVKNDSAGQMVYESQNARSQFKIDPQTDPLLSVAEKIMKTPLTEIGGEGTHMVETTQGGKDEVLVCEEAGDNSLEKCVSDLTVKVVWKKVIKEKSASMNLSGCKKSYKDWHPTSCQSLFNDLRYWRSSKRWRRNPGPIDITSSFKSCFQETLNHTTKGTSNRCEKCKNPRNTIPTDIKVDKIKKVLIERENSGKSRVSGYTNYCSHGKLKGYDLSAALKISYEEDVYEILPDEWVSNCDHLESRVDQGLCSYASKVCTKGRETRVIEGVPITRDCWQETYTYSCSYPSKDNGGSLRARGCVQINSTCKQMVGKSCVLHEQTYQCKGPSQQKHQIIGGQTPFCLDGNCRDQSWDPNDELGSSLAQLSILKELQGKFKDPTIFNGKNHSCSKYILSFKDCCGSGKGWGNDVGLASCKKSAKTLRKLRKEKLCHYVGTYCDKKMPVTGKCIKKKSSFCCFGSKLLRVFHEQGRPQIGLSWGEPKHPLCRGFTINEIQRIDFSKMDLSEVFEDLMKAYTPAKMKNMSPAAKNKIEKTDLNTVGKDIIDKSRSTQMQDLSKRVGERVELLKKGMGPHEK